MGGSLPLTWGYICLGLVATLGLLTTPPKSRWLQGSLLFLAFGLYATFGEALAGQGFPSTRGIAILTVTIGIPCLYFFGIGSWLDQTKNFKLLLRAVQICTLAAAVYGLFLFVYYWRTKSYIDIPYLTVGAGSEMELSDKNNRRGGLTKLFSTYNNGNIYGICTLMLLPLYCILDKSQTRQLIIKLALVLTLSRTIWFALIVHEILAFFLLNKGKGNMKLFALFAFGLLAVFLAEPIMGLMGRDTSWVIDTERLGGRIDQFDRLENLGFFFQRQGSFSEMVWITGLAKYGAVGFLLFLAFMTTPFIGFLYGDTRNELRVAAALGAFNYWVCCLSDGAFVFIPVSAFFWFLATLLWCRNPALDDYAEHSYYSDGERENESAPRPINDVEALYAPRRNR